VNKAGLLADSDENTKQEIKTYGSYTHIAEQNFVTKIIFSRWQILTSLAWF